MERAVEAVAQAADQGAGLVVFPESWLQGYPYFAGLSVMDPTYQAFRDQLWRCAIAIDDPVLQPLLDAAAQHQCAVSMGLQERLGGSIFNTQLLIGASGEHLQVRRKLVPTTVERTVWARGDGSDLAVSDTPVGKVGGLMCFEHQMAPARYVLCSLGCEVHTSVWPGHAFLDGMIDASTRHLAHENACYVLVAREVMSADRLPDGSPEVGNAAGHFETHGGSAIIAPGGEYIVPPVFDEETILVADLTGDIGLAKWWMDGTGHYARPDVFQLLWHNQPKPSVATDDES